MTQRLAHVLCDLAMRISYVYMCMAFTLGLQLSVLADFHMIISCFVRYVNCPCFMSYIFEIGLVVLCGKLRSGVT